MSLTYLVENLIARSNVNSSLEYSARTVFV